MTRAILVCAAAAYRCTPAPLRSRLIQAVATIETFSDAHRRRAGAVLDWLTEQEARRRARGPV